MQYVAKRDSLSPKVLAFRTRMSASASVPIPAPPAPESGKYNAATHGTLAAWVAVAVAGLAFGLTLLFHYTEGQSKASEDHLKVLVDERIEKKLESIDNKLESINNKLVEHERRLSTVEEILNEMRSNVPFDSLLRDPLQNAPVIKDKVA